MESLIVSQTETYPIDPFRLLSNHKEYKFHFGQLIFLSGKDQDSPLRTVSIYYFIPSDIWKDLPDQIVILCSDDCIVEAYALFRWLLDPTQGVEGRVYFNKGA